MLYVGEGEGEGMEAGSGHPFCAMRGVGWLLATAPWRPALEEDVILEAVGKGKPRR